MIGHLVWISTFGHSLSTLWMASIVFMYSGHSSQEKDFTCIQNLIGFSMSVCLAFSHIATELKQIRLIPVRTASALAALSVWRVEFNSFTSPLFKQVSRCQVNSAMIINSHGLDGESDSISVQWNLNLQTPTGFSKRRSSCSILLWLCLWEFHKSLTLSFAARIYFGDLQSWFET